MSRGALLQVAAAVVAIMALLAALGWAVYSSLTPSQQTVVRAVAAEQLVLLVGCGLLFAAVVAAGLGALVNRYAAAARRLAVDAEVVASVNPGQHIAAQGGADMRAAATAVERLAERFREARRDVDEAVRRGRSDLEQERNRLAALMAELNQPVLVCNADGRILLYNEAARDLLGGPGGGYVGLGRSLFGVVDRDLVLHALAYGRELADRGDDRAARFATELAGGLVRGYVTLVRGAEGATTGFVLVLEDVTEDAEMSDRRGAILQDLVEATQRAIAAIRAAVEAVQDFGEVDPEQRARLLGIVRDEAARLTDRVVEARHEAADLVAQRWRLEDMRSGDLLTFVRRRAEQARALRVVVEESTADLWVRVDAYALSRALAAVVQRLADERAVHELTIGLTHSDGHGALDLRWSGPPLDADTLRAWEEEPVAADEHRLPFTLREVLDRHGGEGWSQRDPDTGQGLLRLLLPLAPAPRRQAAVMPPAVVQEGRRPEFYDFDLFRHGEPAAALEGRPLAGLHYTVFDTETTGLDPAEDELIAIGAVRIVNGRLLAHEVFDQLINPGRAISVQSVQIHGITGEMLEGQPGIGDVLPRFARYAEDTVLVGHNVAFDMRFLAEKEASTGVRFTQPVLDTLLLSPVVHPDEPDHSLEAIAARLGVSIMGRHTALGDALVTAEIFLGLVRLLSDRGVETLGRALDASRRTYRARVSDSLYARP